MSVPDSAQNLPTIIERLARYLAARQASSLTRRETVVGLGVVGALLFSFRSRQSQAVHASTESALNDAVTAEGLLVTLLGVARTRATEMTLDEQTVRLVRAAQCEDEAHFNNLVSLGGAPATGRYTVPDSVLENATNFLTTWVELKRIMIGLYLAAGREFGEEEEFDLAEVAYQIGTVEAQHYALLRQYMGERIPADRAFPEWQFDSTSDAVTEIAQLGFIDGTGTSYDYPGPGDRYCRGITGLVSETTVDQTPPDVTPVPASPVSSDATPAADDNA